MKTTFFDRKSCTILYAFFFWFSESLNGKKIKICPNHEKTPGFMGSTLTTQIVADVRRTTGNTSSISMTMTIPSQATRHCSHEKMLLFFFSESVSKVVDLMILLNRVNAQAVCKREMKAAWHTRNSPTQCLNGCLVIHLFWCNGLKSFSWNNYFKVVSI